MVDLALFVFVAAFMALGLRRPFLWVLTYLYIDIVAPQKISWHLLASIPISLIAFAAAFGGWLVLDDKTDSRFTFRQMLLVLLFLYCGYTTMVADFPEAAADKWAWVWKALVFAIFLPLTLRTRLRIEAVVLIMVLSASSIIVTGSIKTVLSGGGYGALQFFVNDNTGLYEGSIISCVAVAIIPLILWLAKYGTVFPPDWRVKLYAGCLVFACLLIPIGTQARTGLICIGVQALLFLRNTQRRFLYLALMGAAVAIAVPFLPASYTQRMNTIENHASDQSASTRLAIWTWTWDYAKDHPLGGGFAAYLGNHVKVETTSADTSGNSTEIETNTVEDAGRAYHSSYFEMLGEQGWPGVILWGLLQLLGIVQMDSIRRRWTKKAKEDESEGVQWQAPLAAALQATQITYLVGAAFVGIAYQPFILMLIGVQCGLWSYLKRVDAPVQPFACRPRTMNTVTTG